MGLCVRLVRGLAFAAWSSAGIFVGTGLVSVATSGAAMAQAVNSIVVEGNRRVEAETIRSYFKPGPGGRLDPPRSTKALKALYRHRPVPGRAHQSCRRPAGRHRGREPGDQPRRLRGQQEGQGRAAQRRSPVEAARHAVARRPCRPTSSASSKSITAAAASTCASMPKIIELPNNRVDLVFEINEGGKTGVKDIDFVGNTPIRLAACKRRDQDRRKQLAELPQDHRHLRSRPRRGRPRTVAPLLSQARLCRRAHRLGGRRIRSGAARASSSPSRSRKAPQYRVGTVDVHLERARDRSGALRSRLQARAGRRLQRRAGREDRRGDDDRGRQARLRLRQRAPARRPQLPDATSSTSSSCVEEGARAYIERINIRGNTRTRDYVIRREFDIGEGDAYNRALIDRAERRLKNLNYFKTVKITNEPGSAPDRVVVNVDVEEQVDRRVLGLRRLFDRRRLHRRSQRRRAQPAGPRPVRQGVGHIRPAHARLRICPSSSRICSAIGWPSASTCSRKQNSATNYVVLQYRKTDRRQSAARHSR